VDHNHKNLYNNGLVLQCVILLKDYRVECDNIRWQLHWDY